MHFYIASIICPPLARYVPNCYYNSRLFIIGGGEIQSIEGTAQGDATVIAIYAIAIVPLILVLVAEGNQVDNTTKDSSIY